MTSAAQMQANRQNALKATGPKSIQGKSIASQNAVKHGLLSKDLLIRDERPKDLQAFRTSIYQALCPQGAMEELLVEKIVNAAWRLHRLTKVEGELLRDGDSIYSRRCLYQAFCGRDGDTLQTLSRYESSLERNFYKAVHELQRVQAMRLGHLVMAPIAIDINTRSDEGTGFVS